MIVMSQPHSQPGPTGRMAPGRISRFAALLLFRLPSLLFRRRLLRLTGAGARHQDVKGIFGRHFFFPAFVGAILVFVVAGTAARLEDFLTHHGHNGVISAAFAARAVIVNIVAQSHNRSLSSYDIDFSRCGEMSCTRPFMIKSVT